MTYTSMPEANQMQFFEDHVNRTGKLPFAEGEPFFYVLPQKFKPYELSKTKRKQLNRTFEVKILFIAAMYYENGKQELRWKYEDVVVIELV